MVSMHPDRSCLVTLVAKWPQMSGGLHGQDLLPLCLQRHQAFPQQLYLVLSSPRCMSTWAVILSRLAPLALLLALAQSPAYATGEITTNIDFTSHTVADSIEDSVTPRASTKPATGPQMSDTSDEHEAEYTDSPSPQNQPRIIMSTPPPSPAFWPLYQRITWGANIVLTVLGYFGIMVAIRTLRAIERQTQSAETAANSAMESANALLSQVQAEAKSSRPWLLVSVQPSPTTENLFRVIVANRGHSPAEIVSSSERIGVATDERQLPLRPEYAKEQSSTLPVRAILLPGESMVLLSFGRDDVTWICKNPQGLRRVELRQEKIFLYGKIIYKDLVELPHSQNYETDWCCRYSHGERNSDLIVGGPSEYNRHT